jgi:hypothetical protein
MQSFIGYSIAPLRKLRPADPTPPPLLVCHHTFHTIKASRMLAAIVLLRQHYITLVADHAA